MNQEIQKRFAEVSLHIPEILLPAPELSLAQFAVIACDQHSAEPAYWEETKRIAGDAPSALHLMLPEAWLGSREEIEPEIPRTMKKYLEDGSLRSIGCGMVYVRREVGPGLVRHGLVTAIDLEGYDWAPGNHNRIRATEATVAERLPERIKIRNQACLEIPHVMVLLDDEENAMSGLLEARRETLPKLYDFELMQGGGRIEGYFVQEESALAAVAEVMEQLLASCEDGFLMAVGDGNHSLAAAKACWEMRKEELAAAGGDMSPEA
ncbi:MAG: DUF1015 family protein, partial [Lachnospiraceae bacterium]|nr:DUF1015 family protein [Lachnospiraceae bacterium]